MESFFASMKKELIYRKKYDTIEEVKTDVFRYIKLFYNRKRLHSSLGFVSPVELRLKTNNFCTGRNAYGCCVTLLKNATNPNEMSVLISSLLWVSILMFSMVIIVILFIVGLTIGRKQIYHWKASVICLIICTIVFVLLQFDYMSPIILDIKQFQTDHYEMAVVKTIYSTNNVMQMIEIELELPNGEIVWVKAPDYIEKGAKIENIFVAKRSRILVGYCNDTSLME